MEQWSEIRRRVLIEGVSQRQILRETGMHWKTLRKILKNSDPPGYQMSHPRSKPKIGPFMGRVKQFLQDDKEVGQKQRHTAKRIWQRLQQEGYSGGYSAVKEAVREIRQTQREVFVPLVHRPGEAQVDFGFAVARVGGQLRKIAFMVMALPYSDAFFVMAFERECTETFWEAHVQGFEFFGGVPRRITYDNTAIAVGKIIGGSKKRNLTQGFLQLKSHYLFEHHFCAVGRPNEKGVVEGMVKFARLNFMVPVPQVKDLEQLNAQLRQSCQEDRQRRLRGQKANKEQLFQEDQQDFLPLPESRFEAARKVSTTVNSLSLVRFNHNDYSVPVRCAHHPVVVKGYWSKVDLIVGSEQVASHPRIWEKEKVSFEPRHYLALLEKKPGALDHARPLADWNLPECFGLLRRRLEHQLEGEGTREYIKVLRLLEKYSLNRVKEAIESALEIGALKREVILQYLLEEPDLVFEHFSLQNYPHLVWVQSDCPNIACYDQLLEQGANHE